MAVLVKAGGAVRGNAAKVDLVEVLAVVRLVRLARRAGPVEGIGDAHVVAGLEVVHVGAHALHDAGTLMAKHKRQRDGHALRAAKLVGVADARGHVAHEDLVVLRFVQLDVLHAVRTVLLVHDQSLDLHECPPDIALRAGLSPPT